ncbi:glycoside hydrolase [Choiromyces venosus 120613-1]|uniref:glucan 1,3-beta-glucosidase n=1 Tax=Choiromyces venosus 120613-1 TaxID=1336337 RepID=A0A3N4JUD0_9PEZI|nr:glycoside hydrolase [Choiromyces venosus 120613-1]
MHLKSLHLLAASLLAGGVQASVLLRNQAGNDIGTRALTFDYGNVKVRGVNLGGWFVLEPWITPSLFEPFGGKLSERLPAKNNSNTTGGDTFYSQADFQQMKAAGLNHVRIPIGYWAIRPLPGDPYVQGQLNHLNNAINWAGNVGLKVWIDLHGAPGSQNGFDNSGRRDSIEWQHGDNVHHTVETIRDLAQIYAQSQYNNVVTAIELLNEPFGWSLDRGRLEQYWRDGWGTVRDFSDIGVVIGDAFFDTKSWNGFMTDGWNHVLMDTHHYQVFDGGQLQQSPQGHVNAACSFGRNLVGVDKWTIVGEWSAARTDCTKWLNGVGRGTRWEGTLSGGPAKIGNCGNRVQGSVASYSPQEKANTRAFIEAQLDAYERVDGWFFWTWKSQGSPDWELQDLLANGLFPQPITSRQACFTLREHDRSLYEAIA